MSMVGLKQMVAIIITLFVVMVVIGVTLLATEKLKSTVCTSYGPATYYWTGTQCQVSATNTTAVTVDAITEINNVKASIVLAISLLGLLVLIVIFIPIIKSAISLGKGSGM